MDGNGRWAQRRRLPRAAGHRAGVEAVRRIVAPCAERGIEVLTLFAFSSENWRRPEREVTLLMELFFTSLQEEAVKLRKNNVRLRVIGDDSAFPPELRDSLAEARRLTQGNDGLILVIAANYGGRWDITQAARALAAEVAAGVLRAEEITDAAVKAHLCLGDLPDPDLFIRTGGEQRISNYLLWQLAYTELFFTDSLWPDFTPAHLEIALNSYAMRQRRFGKTGEQVESIRGA
ncbi:MAG: polyprenyl diphosphate synthase [Rhodospirillales bacterium]|nr:polyprenyl diphosphate synthase [Rhodospirillales bacterium]